MKKDKTQNEFILIKKYSNRRLYNSSKSKYMNFKELFGLIKNNIDFYFAETYHQQYLYKNPNGYCGLGGCGVKFK